MTEHDPGSTARIYRGLDEPDIVPFVPPIPLAEDPLPFFNEPDRSPVAVVWIVVALVFATGFLLGWSL